VCFATQGPCSLALPTLPCPYPSLPHLALPYILFLALALALAPLCFALSLGTPALPLVVFALGHAYPWLPIIVLALGCIW